MKKKRNANAWMRDFWRPLLAVAYTLIIMFDFVVAPILWSGLQVYADGEVTTQWLPLTLNGGGIFHGAMGAILGISAYTRGQEKIENIRNPHVPYSPYTDENNVFYDNQNDFSLNSSTTQNDNMFLSDIYGNENRSNNR